MGFRLAAVLAAGLACASLAGLDAARQGGAGPSARRLTTIHALRQFPGYYHLQSVVLRGTFDQIDSRIVLRADDREMRVVLADDARSTGGEVEVRGQLIDVGRLEPTDPRVTSIVEGRDESDRWPRPGEELVLRVTDVASAQPVIGLTVRDIALEPWRYEGQMVTVVGNFRGRNLFGDLAGSPAASRYDFVIRGAEGAIWVTGQRPRGRGFDLDIDRRVDSDKWLQVTGTVVHDRGLVRIEASKLAAAEPPAVTEIEEEPAVPPPPPPPLEVVFSAPIEGDIGISGAAPVRIQFSRGVDPSSIAGAIRVSYVGAEPGAAPPPFQTSYDGASRALTLRFEAPLEAYRTVRVEVLDTLRAFDGGIATPWALTFSVGG